MIPHIPPHATPDESLRDLGLDAADLAAIALWMDNEHGIRVPDREVEAWHTVGQVRAVLVGVDAIASESAADELWERENWDEDYADDDGFDDCSLMPNGQCLKAGSEECDWECGRLHR